MCQGEWMQVIANAVGAQPSQSAAPASKGTKTGDPKRRERASRNKKSDGTTMATAAVKDDRGKKQTLGA